MVKSLGKMISKWGIKIHQDLGNLQFMVPIPWVYFSVEVGVEFVEIEDMRSGEATQTQAPTNPLCPLVFGNVALWPSSPSPGPGIPALLGAAGLGPVSEK
ncbi:hypothetical protein VULLAG_LOCUS11303 [Vulpes lagopus]